MVSNLPSWLHQIDEGGFVVLPEVYSTYEVDALVQDLNSALHHACQEGAAMRVQGGTVYAARNVLALWPKAAQVWRRQPLPETLAALLGPGFGLVRALFFDKPPENTWSLPWHKDMTIAVHDNRKPSLLFSKPTRKAGVPHVESPLEVLEKMVSVRIHLDDMTEENGPLQVVAGSHRTGKVLSFGEKPPQKTLGKRGDVLLMRPLVTHCSGKSHPDTTLHRRILHLEFAASSDLPDGYSWHTFIRP